MGIADKISSYNRMRKYKYFENNVRFNSSSKILDVGFTNDEFTPIANYLEKKYPFRHKITALGIDGKDIFEKMYPDIDAILYDGTVFPFSDNSFDIGWSNAVIEHVGSRNKQIFFLKELLRTCRIIYFTTPNVRFPVEVHTRTFFLHWLPKSIFYSYLKWIGKSWATKDYMNLLSKKEIIKLCKEAGAKNIKIKGNKFIGICDGL